MMGPIANKSLVLDHARSSSLPSPSTKQSPMGDFRSKSYKRHRPKSTSLQYHNKPETMGEEHRYRPTTNDLNQQWYFDEYSGLYRQHSHPEMDQHKSLHRSASTSQLSLQLHQPHHPSHQRHVSHPLPHSASHSFFPNNNSTSSSSSSASIASLPKTNTMSYPAMESDGFYIYQHPQPLPSALPLAVASFSHTPPPRPFPWPESVDRIHGWCKLARKSKDPNSQLKLCRRMLATLAEDDAHHMHEQARSILSSRHQKQEQQQSITIGNKSTSSNDPVSFTTSPERAHVRQFMMLECLRILKRLSAGQGLGKGGDSEAQFILANCYGMGLLGLVEDHAKAFQWYVQASKQAHPEATYRTAVCHELGIGTRKDGQRAMMFYRKAAHLAHVGSMYKLGIILLRGYYHMTPLPREAISWLQRAASHITTPPPLISSGSTTNATRAPAAALPPPTPPTSSSTPLSNQHYHQSSSSHHVSSLSTSSTSFASPSSSSSVLHHPQPNQSQHHQSVQQAPHALHALAMIQLTGEVGDATSLIADPTYAMELLHQAAQGGYIPSQVQLGHCYEHGQWVPMDDALSIYWYARAAEQGSPEGCLALSGWYLTGSTTKGVMQASDREAYLWARRAAITITAHPTAAHVQATDPLTIAKAHFAVAVYIERGIGVAVVDKDKARRWMKRAAAMGHTGAKHCLMSNEESTNHKKKTRKYEDEEVEKNDACKMKWDDKDVDQEEKDAVQVNDSNKTSPSSKCMVM
ncbi:hypothetical protein BCR42DRAFT_416915 [Absidia repens]|uniref:HCP-like protein n=1 Tax=Absidia repens TaxID=90262 RepID=A0A1X2IFB3_9FUNG|nr:hypothetical protein BCR42DRAFT_416915 [Absidia repens]